MTYWLLGAALTLSTFAVVAAVLSVVSAGTAALLSRRLQAVAPADRAARLFRLRLVPALGAAMAALGLTLPVFLVFEPRDTVEAVPVALAALSGAALAIVARGAWRAVASWRATRAAVRRWIARGRRLDLGAPVPAFAIDDDFPLVAVAGFARPVLFIAERVLRECPDGEVRAMVAHECAHVTARDNLKRLWMRACPDVLPRGGALERAWVAASEEAADAAAVSVCPASAYDLAQGLIRVARLAPVAAPDLASAFYLGGSVESRVRRLVSPPVPVAVRSPRRFVLAAAALLAVGAGMFAPAIHHAIETLVAVLP